MDKTKIGYRALREVGSKGIEDALTKAISDLAEEDYEVEVSAIDFDSTDGAWMSDRTKITIVAHRTRESLMHPDALIEEESASPA